MPAGATPEPIVPDPAGPVFTPVMTKEWNHLLSLHWRYGVDEVQRRLPAGLRVDEFDGSAWVGLIPFVLERIAFPPLPPVPYFGTFPEANVRTYVVDPAGRRSVFFFSLDINRAPPVALARLRYGLAYCWGTARVTRGAPTTYSFRRRWPRGSDAHLEVTAIPGDPIGADDLTDLDHFITARWGMSTLRRGRLLHGPVWHPQWPLHRAELCTLDETLVVAAGLTAPVGAPHVVFSPGVTVCIGPLAPTMAGTGPG